MPYLREQTFQELWKDTFLCVMCHYESVLLKVKIARCRLSFNYRYIQKVSLNILNSSQLSRLPQIKKKTYCHVHIC